MRTLACLAVLLLIGCGNSLNPDISDNQGTGATGVTSLGEGWNRFTPAGESICSDGSPYHFFVRKGDPKKLLVYLMGGGACWTRETCDPNMQPTYRINTPEDFSPGSFGIFNTSNPKNPFRDYSVVYAPYCSGDVHIGASDTVYPATQPDQSPLKIYHRGRANMQAVLDWTYQNVSAPDRIFVTGSSAGAIPSPFYASLIADAYPESRVAQLGDGAGGYRRLNADTRPDEQWGTFGFITSERGFKHLEQAQFNYEKLYIAAAKAHPEVMFAEYDAAHDSVQKRFLALSGSRDVNLLDALKANHADIRAEAQNFRTFIAGGESHTILGRPEFYSYGVDGVSVAAWVSDLANFNAPPDVTCSECAKDTFAGPPLPGPMETLWANWEDRGTQYVEPFQIFDNLYYVGIDWVSAYVLDTGDGLILIDSLYGSWVQPLLTNIAKLGLNPADIKYVINTHGHFDHAGGSAYFQQAYGSTVVMAEEDWILAEAEPSIPRFYMPRPDRSLGIVARDGQTIELGNTRVELFKTPGHTEGVLTLRYTVRDGDDLHQAITLGGVGLNFSGVQRTESYIASYQRLLQLSQGVSVSLPNHAAMGRVFQRAQALQQRQSGDTHPFVDGAGLRADLEQFLAAGQAKLIAEKNGTATDPLEELTQAISD